jgi:hypothetical protein
MSTTPFVCSALLVSSAAVAVVMIDMSVFPSHDMPSDWSDVSFARHADLQKFYCGKRGKSKPPTATLGPDGQWIMNPVQPYIPPPAPGPGPGPRGQQANASHPTQEGASAPAPALTLQQYLDKQKQLLSQLSQNQARAVNQLEPYLGFTNTQNSTH